MVMTERKIRIAFVCCFIVLTPKNREHFERSALKKDERIPATSTHSPFWFARPSLFQLYFDYFDRNGGSHLVSDVLCLVIKVLLIVHRFLALLPYIIPTRTSQLSCYFLKGILRVHILCIARGKYDETDNLLGPVMES